MKQIPFSIALAALSLGLCACNDSTQADNVGKSPQAAPAAAPPAPAAEAPKSAPLTQLSADMELSSKVKRVLQEADRGHIEIAANDGVVTLYGTVDAIADKQRIALDAMNVEGVRSVVNNLVVVRGS